MCRTIYGKKNKQGCGQGPKDSVIVSVFVLSFVKMIYLDHSLSIKEKKKI